MPSTKLGSMMKPSPSPPASRPKKASRSQVVVLKLSPEVLSNFPNTAAAVIKGEPDQKATSSASISSTHNAASPDPPSLSNSNSNTPAPSATEDSASMPPPSDGAKKSSKAAGKKGAAVTDGLLKPRGKPGPKKKQKMDDGTEPASGFVKPAVINAQGAHKLGPKANQGAINAGLRALDRSGKPCRKWQKGGFQIKSFTGTTWELPRWSAPPKFTINGEPQISSSGDGSSKENKDSNVDSEKSASQADIEMSNISMDASSPAPVIAVTA